MFYSMLRIFFRAFFKVLFGARVIGRENLPAEGAIILAANHMSNWDPPLLATFLERKVNYMAKEELFANKIFATAITNLGAFPVKRGTADRNAIKRALALLIPRRDAEQDGGARQGRGGRRIDRGDVEGAGVAGSDHRHEQNLFERQILPAFNGDLRTPDQIRRQHEGQSGARILLAIDHGRDRKADRERRVGGS